VDGKIVVDEVAQQHDKADDFLGKIIPRRRFCPKDIGARHKIHLRIFAQLLIDGQNMECVEQLTLVFVHPLDLHIKNRIRIDGNAVLVPDIFCHPLLIGAFDFFQSIQRAGVVRKRSQLFELGGIGDKALSKLPGQKRAEPRIGLAEPAAVGNAVRHIFEFVRHHGVKIMEDGFLQNLTV